MQPNTMREEEELKTGQTPQYVKMNNLERLKGKKWAFQKFYQMVKPAGGTSRVKIQNRLSKHHLAELDGQLAYYACMNSHLWTTSAQGQRFKQAKQVAEEKATSIITRCCFRVSEHSIREFFQNDGLRAAWTIVNQEIYKERPHLQEVFDILDRYCFMFN